MINVSLHYINFLRFFFPPPTGKRIRLIFGSLYIRADIFNILTIFVSIFVRRSRDYDIFTQNVAYI